MSDERWLPARGLLALRSHGALTVCCATGAVWVTQAGREEDHVLEAGEALVLPANAHSVVQALSDATVRVCERVVEALQARAS